MRGMHDKASSLARLILLIAGLTIFHTVPAASSDPLSDTHRPDPSLSPTEVVRVQLEALRSNDDADRGIAVAFRFASPQNRSVTGPLSRFVNMIRVGPYSLMLSYRQAIYEDAEVRGDQARVRVILLGSRESVAYEFYLSRQAESPYVGCWMTDRVTIQPAGGSMALGGWPRVTMVAS